MLTIAWWNGGGKIVPRLRTNPGLQEFISTRPDIFVYGEALVTKKTKDLKIPGYNTIIHKAQIQGIRRGLVVYLKQKHAYSITKDSSSNTYDILWLRMKTTSN